MPNHTLSTNEKGNIHLANRSDTPAIKKPNRTAAKYLALGIAIGCGAGVAMNNIPLGVGLGAALALILIFRKRRG